MNIILYKSNAEPNRLDKTNFLIKSIELIGTLKQSTSLINPSIIVELEYQKITRLVDSSNLNVVDSTNNQISTTEYFFVNYNYAYIPQFDRYYFITDIISIRQNIWQLDMHVDVLMSYKNQLLELDTLISRNENTYNPELTDNQLILENKYDIEFINIDTDLFNIDDTNNNNLVITNVTR